MQGELTRWFQNIYSNIEGIVCSNPYGIAVYDTPMLGLFKPSITNLYGIDIYNILAIPKDVNANVTMLLDSVILESIVKSYLLECEYRDDDEDDNSVILCNILDAIETECIRLGISYSKPSTYELIGSGFNTYVKNITNYILSFIDRILPEYTNKSYLLMENEMYYGLSYKCYWLESIEYSITPNYERYLIALRIST